ncbi:hypothetical protein J4456_03985 [Candidatus Pacearchaeota archaeon]|nr:hypothetical protein [Candidatus Pacearchaeota archaeon]
MASKNKYFLVILPLIILGLFILWILYPYVQPKKSEVPEVIELSPDKLVMNKEMYENKQVIMLNAYIPSEAFIYVNEGDLEERIFIDPPNKEYCRNFNLIGTLQRDVVKQWVFYIEEAECLE